MTQVDIIAAPLLLYVACPTRTVIARAGFKEQFELSRAGTAQQRAKALAAVPQEVGHFALDALFERPVQVALVALLLLPKDDERFTSCVLVHGMGGTGKTVSRAGQCSNEFVAHVISLCAPLGFQPTR